MRMDKCKISKGSASEFEFSYLTFVGRFKELGVFWKGGQRPSSFREQLAPLSLSFFRLDIFLKGLNKKTLLSFLRLFQYKLCYVFSIPTVGFNFFFSSLVKHIFPVTQL
jgi:hypothetical protein